MDPNETLNQLRELVLQMEQCAREDTAAGLVAGGEYHEIAAGFATAFNELDVWLVKGGFPPSAWRSRRDEMEDEG